MTARYAKNKRFTIYDMMEERGEFAENPANLQAMNADGTSAYKKAEFPKMVYHPEGLERIVFPGEMMNLYGVPTRVGVQKELINKLVNTPEELELALAEGWHTRPGAATAKRTGEAPPPASAQEVIEQLQAELKREQTKSVLAQAERAGAVVVPKTESPDPIPMPTPVAASPVSGKASK